MPENDFVLLLKAAKGEDGLDLYEKILNDKQFMTTSVPVLGFKFINSDELSDSLLRPDNFSSVVLTSQRAVAAISLVISSCHKLKNEWTSKSLKSWNKKPCFVVGKATAMAAEKVGFTVQGQDSGNAENLGPVIIQEISGDTRPVLFPCGNIKRETIPMALKKENIHMTSIIVYETAADSSIKDNLQKVFNSQGIPEYIVFFSPSGVNFTHPVLEALHLSLENTKIIAIGPTTEATLLQKSLTVASTCEKPTPISLVQTLLKLKNTS